MRTAIYALSADPVTHGHIDIIRRARRVFDDVVVAVGNNSGKKYTFTLQERVRLVKQALEAEGLILEVLPFEGLLVDLAYSKGIHTVIRGVRNSTDFVFEQMLHDINYGQRLGVDTFLIIADQTLSHVSSSAVKELQQHSAKDILDYVSLPVKQALEERMLAQVRIGVTGEIGAGKSYVVRKYIERGVGVFRHGMSVVNFPNSIVEADLDVIAKDILASQDTLPLVSRARDELRQLSGLKSTDGGAIDIKSLSSWIFSSEEHRKEYNRIMMEPILYFLRRDYFSRKNCLVFVCSALLADCDGTALVNNNVIIVKAEESVRRERLKKRGYSDEEVNRRMSAQLCYEEKKRLVQESITKCGHGSLLSLDNTIDEVSTSKLAKVTEWIQKIPSFLV